MSVYTSVEPEELRDFLKQYDLGSATEFVGIANGVENTNYFLTTERGRFVLTLFERHRHADLQFFLGLVRNLADQGLPCPKPLNDNAGQYLNRIKGKYAAIVQRLPGIAPVHPSQEQCAAVGNALARIHLCGERFSGRRKDGRGKSWRRRLGDKLLSRLGEKERELLIRELAFHENHSPALPAGIIHADLFRDNTLFLENRLTGLIDFYLACQGDLLYDLAICVNDWCIEKNGRLDTTLCRSLIGAYHHTRPLTAAEKTHWPQMLRRAALRFWLSRLDDLHFPRGGEITHIKDPKHFQRILEQRIKHPQTNPEYWPTE